MWLVQQAASRGGANSAKIAADPKRGSLVRWFLVLGSKRLETTEAWISFYLLLALVTSVVWLWWQLFCGQLKAWLNPISVVYKTEIKMKKTISALRLLILTGTFVTWLPAHIKFTILHIILEPFEIIIYLNSYYFLNLPY